jgi:hypothetical protein
MNSYGISGDRSVASFLEKEDTYGTIRCTYRLCVSPIHGNVLVVILDQIYLTGSKLQSFKRIPLVSSNSNDVSSIIAYLQN